MRAIILQAGCIAIAFTIQAYLYVNSFSYAHLCPYAHTETPQNLRISVLIQQTHAFLQFKYYHYFGCMEM